jgi:transposase InsO family protein
VPKFAEIAKPLTSLTRKDQPFTWGPSQQEAFKELKDKLCTTPVLAFPDFSLPFILTTDASKLALGAILSQVQNGEERPIAYASRQTNKAEQSYAATEAEMLAMVWATKHFRCYLHGRKFVARTDNSALTYLRNFADQNSRLLRWSIKLSELHFTVEHRAGTKMAHVDALSRHVGTIAQGGTLEKENVLHEQGKDDFCRKQNPGTYSSRKEYFLDDDGVLYRRRSRGNHQLVVPATLVLEIIRQNHDPVYVAHPGTKRTHDLIALHYWWPGMRKEIEDYIRKCDLCQKRKRTCEFTAPLGEVQEPTAPFQVTALDITGPYKTTPRGNKYLLTFIDHFSKFTEAFPIVDQTAETCARVYATQIVSRYGTGAQLVTDQGSAFMSSFFQETCKVLGIRRTRTTSYHPASNGMLERWHKDLHTALSHYVNAANTDWDTIVPFFLMAHRAQPHSSTGYSPFFLLHGREMQLPSNDTLRARRVQGSTDLDRRIENLKASLRRAYKEVRKSNRKAHQNNKKFYDRKAKERRFASRRSCVFVHPCDETRADEKI